MKNIILQGDAWDLAKTLPDESINCIVTSPPYFGLRDYGTAQWEGGDAECDHRKIQDAVKAVATSTLGGGKATTGHLQEGYKSVCGKCGARRVDSQFGLETTVEEYVDKLVALFRELRRALRHDGVLFLNLGDSYANPGNRRTGEGEKQRDMSGGLTGRFMGTYNNHKTTGQRRTTGEFPGLKPKDLIGIPWRVAFALQADGWYLRSEIIWHKRAPMPESVTDRPTKAHEQVFLLTKSPRYFYDADAIREKTGSEMSWDEYNRRTAPGATWQSGGITRYAGANKHDGGKSHPNGRNKRSVWTLGPESYKGAHFAVMPTKLVEPCILAGCPHRVCAECGAPWVRQVERELVNTDGWGKATKDHTGNISGSNASIRNGNGRMGDSVSTTTGFAPTCECGGDTRPGVVLDPFFGSGTVGVVARRLGRDWLGFELNPEYVELAYKRIDGTQPPLFVEGL